MNHSCTGNCFNTQYYLNLIKEAMLDAVAAECNISEANIVENELQKIAQSKYTRHHCTICYERSTRCLWFAYEQLKE